MQFYEEDVNRWEGWGDKLIKLSDVEGMKYLCEIISTRVVELGYTLINSDETCLINYLKEDNNFELYKEVEQGLFKHIATMELPKEEDKYIFVREDVIVQGVSKDEEGNLIEADIVGIKIDVVEPIDIDGFEYNEDYYCDIEEEIIKNEFFNCNELIKIKKSEEDKYLSF